MDLLEAQVCHLHCQNWEDIKVGRLTVVIGIPRRHKIQPAKTVYYLRAFSSDSFGVTTIMAMTNGLSREGHNLNSKNVQGIGLRFHEPKV
jgi:hypothetical protein